jgi:hypothetical protein
VYEIASCVKCHKSGHSVKYYGRNYDLNYLLSLLLLSCFYLVCVFSFFFLLVFTGAHGSVVGSRTMLQAGRSPVRVQDEADFFNLPNRSNRTMTLKPTSL